MLKRVAQVNPAVPELEWLDDDEEVTFVPLEAVWEGDRADFTRRAAKVAVASGYTRFLRGDALMPKITPTFEAGRVVLANISTPVGAGTTELHVVRTSPRLDGRYLTYLLRSQPVLQEGASTLQGVGNLRRVPEAWLTKLPVPVDDLVQQVAIADFLDRETAKIDALIGKQRRMIQLARVRLDGIVSELVDPVALSAPGPKLKHFVSGIRQGWSPQCNSWPAEPGQWAVLKAGCANGGSFRPNENKALPVDLRPRPDTVVRAGELLVSRANTRELVGSAAVVRGDYPRLMLSDKTYALRFRSDINPEFLARALGTRRYRDLIELEATGASPSMQNISQDTILDLPLCVPPIEVQDELVVRLEKASAASRAIIEKAERLIQLVQERRSALITAAVTGQLDVPTGKMA